MESNFKDLGDAKKELEVTLTPEELQPHFEKALINYKKKATIQGFRKGKAPLYMIKKMYGEAVEYNELEKIAENTFKKCVEEEKLKIADIGSLTDMNYKPGESFNFKIEFEYFPEVVIEKYKGFELTKTVYNIKDEAVNEEVHKILFEKAEKVLDGQVLDKEYMATIDVNEIDETGNIIVGSSEKDVSVYIGDKHLEKNLYDALQGIKEGEEKQVELKGKDDKLINYKIQCKKIEKLVFPEITPEFIKSITGKDDLLTEEDFRKFIKSQMEMQYENSANETFDNLVISEIVRANEYKLPESFVKNVLHKEFEDAIKEYPKYAEHLKEEEFIKHRRADTVFFLKWHILKDEIIKIENIEVTDDDITKFAEKNSKLYNIPLDKLTEIYKKSPEVNSKALEKKLIQFIIDNSTVHEEVKEIGEHSHEHNHEHKH